MADPTEPRVWEISNHLLRHHLDAPNCDFAKTRRRRDLGMFAAYPIILIALPVAVFAIKASSTPTAVET